MSKIHYRTQYWMDAFEAACEECGLDSACAALTEEQKLAAAELIEGAVECQDQAFGPTPENPLIDEIADLKRTHASELAREAKRFDVLLKEACRVARVDPSRVSVSETELLVHRS